MEQEHLVATLFAGFAILALALAATGLYTGEFGIRMALGARHEDVLIVTQSVCPSNSLLKKRCSSLPWLYI
jgi:hypothetical protein